MPKKTIINVTLKRYAGVEQVMPMEKRMVPLNIRVPRPLKNLMRRYIDLDAHKDMSEFTRDAIREKIKRDAPDLYKQLFQEAPSSE